MADGMAGAFERPDEITALDAAQRVAEDELALDECNEARQHLHPR